VGSPLAPHPHRARRPSHGIWPPGAAVRAPPSAPRREDFAADSRR